MKKHDEAFSTKVQEELKGAYLLTPDNNCLPILPREEPLTKDNFCLITDNSVFYADDFDWWDIKVEDFTFKYGNNDDYLDNDSIPDEVCCLLDTVICIKFATRSLADAKAMLDATDNNKAKQAINNAIIAFDKTTDSKEKMLIAAAALYNVAEIFEDDSLSDPFYIANSVIREIISELSSDKS